MNPRSSKQFKNSILIPVLFIVIGFIFIQCGPKKKTEQGILTDHSFTNAQIGWTIEFPDKRWSVMNVDASRALDAAGAKAIEDTGQKVDSKGFKNLIGFKINDLNVFQSTIEPFDVAKNGNWVANHTNVKKIMMNVYSSKGIKADSTETTNETIGGKKFENYKITIYRPDNTILLQQLIYSSLINGFDFNAIISTSNEENMNEMLETFKNSKFSK